MAIKPANLIPRTALNRASRFFPGVSFAYYFGSTLENLVGNALTVDGAAYSWVDTIEGRAVRLNAGDATTTRLRMVNERAPSIADKQDFTVAVRFATTDNYAPLLSLRNAGDDNPIIDLFVGYNGVTDAPGKALAIFRGNGTTLSNSNATYANTVNDGLIHTLAVRREASAMQISLDGGFWYAFGSTPSNSIAATFTADMCSIGAESKWIAAAYATLDQRYADATIFCAVMWSRALSNADIAAFHADPYGLVRVRKAQGLATGGATTKTITDSATATDAIGNIAVGLLLSDTAAGNDALPGAAAEFGLADTGAGNDAIAQLLASLSQGDNGSGADAVSNIAAALTLADSGAGNDAAPSIEALLQITDSGSGADLVTVLSELLKTILDSGAGSDALAISAGIVLSDAGAGNDEVSIAVTLTLTDTGAGADALSILTDILKSIMDAGAGSDAIAGISVQASVSDTAAGNDAQSIAVTLAVTDSLSGVDDVLASVLIALADSGLGGDALAIAVQASVMDSGTGVDAMPAITAALQIIDAAGGTDAVLAFDAQTRIAKIRFSLRGRTMTMTLKGRKAKFTLH